MAKIYVSASYADLKAHREAVGSVLRRQGHQVHGLEDYAAAEDRPLEQCLADVGACDLYVAIMAWHYGFVPPERNPDGRSITELEYRAAVECRKPRLIFMAREGAAWPMRFVDRGERAMRVRALRAALGDERLARRFDTPHELTQHVTVALARWQGRAAWTIPTTDPVQNGASSPGPLAHAPPRLADSNPDLPEDPYPGLEAYDHPAMLGGRDRELAEVERRLGQSRLVLALHAPAGAGKSSLLRAGLAPRLRAGGSPVAVEPRPGEPNLAFRLLADLFDLPEAFQLADDQRDLPDMFAAGMKRAYRLAGKPPILILDQVDDVLRQPASRQEALARLGPLMAATAQQPPGRGGCSCRWLLCYRREFHGEVVEWLQDVLAPARAAGRRGLQALPHDLSGSDHFESWAVPAMGVPPPGEDPVQAAREAFVGTIRRPLTLRRPDGSPRYDLRISDQDVERLAEAFVRARTRDATEPLVPELQVVLAHLLRQARTGSCGERVVVLPRDPEALDRLIDDALAAQLGRAVEALVAGRDAGAGWPGRSRILFVLRELAYVLGSRSVSPSVDAKGEASRTDADVVAAGGNATLETSHTADGFAELRTGVDVGLNGLAESEDPAAPGGSAAAGNDVPPETTVELATPSVGARPFGGEELEQRIAHCRDVTAERATRFGRHGNGDALELSDEDYQLIVDMAPMVILDEERRRWWEACRALRAGLNGTGGRRWESSAARISAVETLLSRDGDARFLADAWFLPADAMRGFVAVPEGPFHLGSDPRRDPNARGNEQPARVLEVATFYIARWPVTVAQFRRFVEDAADNGGFTPGDPDCLHGHDSRPVVWVSWAEASAYCEWLSRKLRSSQGPPDEIRDLIESSGAGPAWRVTLPSEVEWEKAARGGDERIYPWGDEIDPDRANYEATGVGGPSAVGCFPRGASPYGVEDLSGNVWEWTRSLYRAYPYEPTDGREDPHASGSRVVRGGSHGNVDRSVRAVDRYSHVPDLRGGHLGFRVVLARV